MSGLYAAACRLCDVLEAENLALSSLDFGRIGVFQDEKRTALEGLNRFAAQAADPAVGTDPAMGARLQWLAEENKRLLERAIMVQKRIMAVLASAARTAQAPVGYGSKGKPPPYCSAGAVALVIRA